ncbi:MAG: hypothetical protein J6S40_06360 [Thermoguttaceae bacterium]|nr:hypothetical protein [Thermoguttaceae bacterium]
MKRIGPEIAMAAILPFLMAYSLVGEAFHEVAGTAAFCLFLLHHFRRGGWYRAFFRGAYTPKRLFNAVLDVLLLIWTVLQPLCGVLISKHLWTFVRIPVLTSPAREAHLFLAYWGFLFLALHTGAHLIPPIRRLTAKNGGKRAMFFVSAFWTAAALYGCRALLRRQFADYLFRRVGFIFLDFSEPRFFFFLDYVAVFLLFAGLGAVIADALVRLGGKKTPAPPKSERV